MKSHKRISYLVISVISFYIFYQVFYSQSGTEPHVKDERIKYILLWNTFWDDDSWMFR